MNQIVIHQPQYGVSDLERIAKAIASSKLFGVQNVDQALALCLVAQAEGRHPATASQDYSIIQGRPSKKSDAMLRDFLSSGGKVEWHELSNEKADATFAHPAGGKVRIDWTLERAKAAGISNAMYSKYPRQMLRARCVSEGVRTVCPGATSGMYVPEEVQDFEPQVTVQQMDDDLPAIAQPRKSSAQAKKDGDYERLTSGMRACTDEASLKAWGAANAEDIGALPHKWQAEIRKEYVELLRGFKAQSADPMGLEVAVPENGGPEEWGDWFEEFLVCISGAQTPEEVTTAQRVNAEGLALANMVIENVAERVAAASENRIAELLAKAA